MNTEICCLRVHPGLALLPTTPFEKANLFGGAVRLNFHDADEANLQNSTDTFGPDGCLSSSSDNAGLVESTSLVNTVIEPMWQKYCDKISRADFWVLFGKLSLEAADPTNSIKLDYQFGRQDKTVCELEVDRLPNPQYGVEMLEKVFVTQMGLTMEDAVTLLGAHTLGHTHIENSGYGLTTENEDFNPCGDDAQRANCLNAWVYNPHEFDNGFYYSLFVQLWDNKQPNGPDKNLWVLGSNTIMMNTDMVLAYNITFTSSALSAVGQQCGPYNRGALITCTMPDAPTSSSFELSTKFAADNSFFLSSFATSFKKMTTVGYSTDSATPGKLGSLTGIDLNSCSAK
mmetsp:Transcript_29859/g.41008  ORF Transcript_29859/g.41008 Transcript_29859/m.41008 type:complete len:343 (+) Transcript_29859:425-1453(+)